MRQVEILSHYGYTIGRLAIGEKRWDEDGNGFILYSVTVREDSILLWTALYNRSGMKRSFSLPTWNAMSLSPPRKKTATEIIFAELGLSGTTDPLIGRINRALEKITEEDCSDFKVVRKTS